MLAPAFAQEEIPTGGGRGGRGNTREFLGLGPAPDAAAAARGEKLYAPNCALCHGEKADGHGARSMGLDRKPANFTEAVWSSPEGATRAFQAISKGIPGSAMPPWEAALSPDDRWALVAFLASVSERSTNGADR